jgi:uncharacterized protein (UPF0276 family)
MEADDFLVDTHGADIIDPVWKLLGKAYELMVFSQPCLSVILIFRQYLNY